MVILQETIYNWKSTESERINFCKLVSAPVSYGNTKGIIEYMCKRWGFKEIIQSIIVSKEKKR